MAWINPLDKVPQVPVDWANHIVYGGVVGVLLCFLGVSITQALATVFVISAAKKIVDYFKVSETIAMCVGKTLVSCVWPLSIFLLELAGKV